MLAVGLLLAWSPRVVAVGLFAVASFSIILYWISVRQPPVPRFPVAWAVALFIGYACVTALWSTVPAEAREQVAQFIAVFVPALFFFQVLLTVRLDPQGLARRSLMIGLALGIALFSLELLADQPLYRLTRGLDFSVTLGANSINRPAALCALFVWPLAFALWQQGWRKSAIALPLVLTALILGSSSQSASGGLLVGLGFLAIAAVSRRAACYLAGGILVAGFLFMVPIANLLDAVGLAEVQGLPFSMGHRVMIWDFVADRVLERPIFGWGLEASRGMNNFGVAPPVLFDGPVELLPLHPHNAFLQVWLELGGVGAILALVMALTILRTIRGLPQTAQLFAYPLLICGFFMSGTAYGSWQTWWMTGFLTAAALFIIVLRSAPEPATGRVGGDGA